MNDTRTIIQSYAELGDPHICSDFRDRQAIFAAIYEALIRRDPRSGEYVGVLAETWTCADDACTWTFQLRQRVRFHNGDRLTAADAVASLERVCDPTLGGELGTQGVYLSYLEGARFEAIGSNTLRVITARPLADLLDLLVDMPIVPRRVLGGLPGIAVGSGPYRLGQVGIGRLVLETFDSYWGATPNIKRLTWLAEPDAARRAEQVLGGIADIAANLDAPRVTRLKAAGLQCPQTLSGLCVIVLLNCADGPCTDRRVRQALNYATNVPALVQDVLNGAAEPLNGPLTRLHFAHDPATPPYPYDPALAEQLLAEAGYPHGLKLTLHIPTTHPDESIALAQHLAEQWAQVGIDLLVSTHTDRPGYADLVRAKQIGDASLFDSSPLSSMRVLHEKIHSGRQGPWWQGYQNPEVDTLIDQASATVTKSRRQAIYRQAYRIIRDDAPWVFLYSPLLSYGLGQNAANWKPGRDGLIRFS
jgi:peptide/nickel transport system substrate-binding protein